MKARTAVGHVLTALLLVFLASMLLGQLLGQPVLLSFVETGSMEPTMEPADGFVAIPDWLAGPIEPGDVIVFDAERLHGGGLVTHRVVAETEDGFITKGDANPFTDQESSENEPPVQKEQILAVAWQLGGNVVVIPKIGLLVIGVRDLLSGLQQQLAVLFGTRALLGTQGLAYILFAVGVLIYLGSYVAERRGERRAATRRNRVRGRTVETTNRTAIVFLLTVILIALVTASMTIPGGTHQFGFVSSQSDAPGAGVIPVGGSETTTYLVPSNGLLPVVVFLEPTSDAIDVEPRELFVPSGGTMNATVTLTAPPRTGYYRRYLVEHRYLAILPRTTIRSLYRVHPWLPVLAIDALLGVAFFAFATGMIGLGKRRIRNTDRETPLSRRLQRWLR